MLLHPARHFAVLSRLGPELADMDLGLLGSTSIGRGTATKLGGRIHRMATTSLSGGSGWFVATVNGLLLPGLAYEMVVICHGRSVSNASNAVAAYRSTGQNAGLEGVGTQQIIVTGPGVFRARIVGTATLDTLTMGPALLEGALTVVGDTWDLESSIRRIV